MPTENVEYFVRDPESLWLLRFALVALLIALPMTIAAHFAKARRSTILLTFPIAFAALLAGHYAGWALLNGWGGLIAVAAVLVTLCVGIRYVLGTTLLATAVVASATAAVLLVGFFVALQFGWV